MLRAGFTLIELLIVVVMFGILAGAAVMRFGPNASGYTFAECQHKKIAEKTLRAILAAEKSYRRAEDKFTSVLTELPVSDVNGRSTTDNPVTYNISATTADLFDGSATYTKRASPLVMIKLQYDAGKADEPRESKPVEISCQ